MRSSAAPRGMRVLLAGVLLALALPAGAAAPAPGARPPAPLDVNAASLAQLKKLPGVGDAEARRIIAHRPYLTKEAMVTSGAITRGTFVAIRRHVLVNPPALPPASAARRG